MKEPEEVKCQLDKMKNTFIGKHLLRTIHNTLTVPNVSYETKKGIQILRHEFSRRRSCLFNTMENESKEDFEEEEEDFNALMCQAQLNAPLPEPAPTQMDRHLENVLQQYNKIKESTNELNVSTNPTIPRKFTINQAKARLNKILKERDSAYEEEDNSQKLFHLRSSYAQSSLKVDRNGFFDNLSPEQREAGE